MNKSKINYKNLGTEILLLALDVLIVNASYYAALFLRFYLNHSFNKYALHFVYGFYKVAPVYTVCCLVIFCLFKLYKGAWKYAGYNDLNRILMANAVCIAVQVVASIVVNGFRMPFSYYIVGAAIQIVLTCLTRLSYRLIVNEINRVKKNRTGDSVNVMVVGVGETARSVLKQLEEDKDSSAKPVCVMDCLGTTSGSLFYGLPVVDDVETAKEKYKLQSVIIANSVMPERSRKDIKQKCKELGLQVQDLYVYSPLSANGISLRHFMEYAQGRTEIRYKGEVKVFEDSEEVLDTYHDKYIVQSVKAEADRLVVTVITDAAVMNNVNEDWVKEYEKDTGEQISFF